jgi:hypothetical protein
MCSAAQARGFRFLLWAFRFPFSAAFRFFSLLTASSRLVHTAPDRLGLSQGPTSGPIPQLLGQCLLLRQLGPPATRRPPHGTPYA